VCNGESTQNKNIYQYYKMDRTQYESDESIDECAGTTCVNEECCPPEIVEENECEWEDMTDVLMDLNDKVDVILELVKKLLPVKQKVKALTREEISFVGDSD